MLISFSGKLYATDKNAGVKDANPLFSVSFINILVVSILGKIHPMTSAQWKIYNLVVTLVIPDLRKLSYMAKSSNPASGTFYSTRK